MTITKDPNELFAFIGISEGKLKDLKIICAWFNVFGNMVAKHGILESDIWSYDETGFIMGHISTNLVVTSSKGCEGAKKIQLGNYERAIKIQAVQSGGEAISSYMVVAVTAKLVVQMVSEF